MKISFQSVTNLCTIICAFLESPLGFYGLSKFAEIVKYKSPILYLILICCTQLGDEKLTKLTKRLTIAEAAGVPLNKFEARVSPQKKS